MRSTPFALGALVLAFVLSPPAGAPSAAAASPCWQTVISDWSRDGRVDGAYTATCYRQAMQNAPTDLKIYSTIEDDLQRALSRRDARRLAGTHVATASLAGTGGSSASVLVGLVAGLAALLALAGGTLALARRRGIRS